MNAAEAIETILSAKVTFDREIVSNNALTNEEKDRAWRAFLRRWQHELKQFTPRQTKRPSRK